MTADLDGLAFEMEGYPKEEQTMRSFKATRKLWCAWDDRATVIALLMNYPGHVYPYCEAPYFQVRCRHISVDPADNSELTADENGSNLAVYDKAIITAVYESPEHGDPHPHPNETKAPYSYNAISEQLEPSVKAIPLTASLYKWDSDGHALNEDESPVKEIYTSIYHLTRFYQKTIPQEASEWCGQISSADYTCILLKKLGTGGTTSPHVFKAGDMMYVGPSIEETFTPEGEMAYNITYRFEIQKVDNAGDGWLKFWRGDKNLFDKIASKDAGTLWTPGTQDFRTWQP